MYQNAFFSPALVVFVAFTSGLKGKLEPDPANPRLEGGNTLMNRSITGLTFNTPILLRKTLR